jgi:hypothetical protein
VTPQVLLHLLQRGEVLDRTSPVELQRYTSAAAELEAEDVPAADEARDRLRTDLAYLLPVDLRRHS